MNDPNPPLRHPRIEIEYWRQCGFLLGSAWIARELAQAFSEQLGEGALVPGSGGNFVVRSDTEVLFSRREAGRFPEAKELRRLVAARLAPEPRLGHRHDP